jgi:hypothetical protein
MKYKIKLTIILSVALGILIYNHFFFSPVADEDMTIDKLNDLQKESFSTLIEMTKLLISLSTALFGLIGYFALENYKTTGKIELKYQMDIVVAFCFSALSIDFGYILMEKWVEMLSIGIFQPYDKLTRLPQNLQIISFISALIFTSRFLVKILFNSRIKI